jgi:hypothetical protein
MYEGRLKSSCIYLMTTSWNYLEVRWRSVFRSTSFGKRCTSYNALPTSKTCCRPLIFEISCLGAPFSWLKKPRNRVGRDLNCMADVLMVFHRSTFSTPNTIQFHLRPIQFLGFSNHEKGAPRQEISKWSTVCSTYSRSGWSVVRSASLAKGGTSKKRPSPHLHEVPTRSNKVSPRTFQTAIVRIPPELSVYCPVLTNHILRPLDPGGPIFIIPCECQNTPPLFSDADRCIIYTPGQRCSSPSLPCATCHRVRCVNIGTFFNVTSSNL